MSLVVLIKDGRSRYLSAGPSFILLFSDSNQGDYFVVQMRDNSVSLLHEKTGRWVGIEAGKPRLQQSPAAINMFVNPERRKFDLLKLSVMLTDKCAYWILDDNHQGPLPHLQWSPFAQKQANFWQATDQQTKW